MIFGSIMLIISWLNLLSFTKLLSLFGLGTYIEILWTVIKTMMRQIPLLLVFIVAFGLAFHLLLFEKVGRITDKVTSSL